MAKAYAVRAVHCDHRASDQEVYERLCAATDPLSRAWDRIERARLVVIKANMAMPSDNIRMFAGRRQELVDDAVFRSVLRRLRERSQARLLVLEAMSRTPDEPEQSLNFRHLLDEFDVEYVDGNQPPFAIHDVPGGGNMFARYKLSACLAEADAVVSVAKMKNHRFQGVTLSLKNLFGLPPLSEHGRTRRYYHHLIRLSYVLPDLGLIASPCLNIVDGLVAQSGQEWGGDGVVANVLVAGDHPIATDACGTWLMGHDPKGDWPSQPYLRDRNALLVAARAGFGTVELGDIDFESEVERPVGRFAALQLDPPRVVERWRVTTCEQALLYRDNVQEFLDRYAGQYIMLQEGQVIWHGEEAADLPSRRILAGNQKESAIWIKLVDPKEKEGERFDVYERELAVMRSLSMV